MPHTAVKSPNVFDRVAPKSQATLTPAGRMLHISGQTPTSKEGFTVAVGDVKLQTEKVFENIRHIVESAGGSISDVCRIVIYVIDRSDLPIIMGVRERMLPKPYPATTSVVVSGLGLRDWLVEIEATAVLSATQ